MLNCSWLGWLTSARHIWHEFQFFFQRSSCFTSKSRLLSTLSLCCTDKFRFLVTCLWKCKIESTTLKKVRCKISLIWHDFISPQKGKKASWAGRSFWLQDTLSKLLNGWYWKTSTIWSPFPIFYTLTLPSAIVVSSSTVTYQFRNSNISLLSDFLTRYCFSF
jgi:hypothetical protein